MLDFSKNVAVGRKHLMVFRPSFDGSGFSSEGPNVQDTTSTILDKALIVIVNGWFNVVLIGRIDVG